MTFTITDCDGNVLASGAAGYSECLDLPDNYSINMSDSWGDGWAEDAITVGDMSYTMADGSEETVTVGSCETAPVCTDVSVSNVGLYPSEISFTITDCDGNILASGAAGYSDCLELPENYAINMSDSFGWGADAITIGDVLYNG